MKAKDDDEKDKSKSKLDPIPLDIEVEILTRLPAKSLLKFRCVSEIWSSIIRSQRFIDSFFAMSLTRPRFIVALSSGIYNKPEDQSVFFFSSSSHESSSSSLVANLDMTIPYESLNNYARSLASVHGFLGVSVRNKFIICNPSTKQVIKLPNNHYNFLGYDPIDDKHKVLSLRWMSNDHLDIEHKVLTLGRSSEGECWRHIKATTMSYSPTSAGICINGFVYYGAFSPSPMMKAFIACFDVRSETLSFIIAPEAAYLLSWKGKLASIVKYPHHVGFDGFDSFDLWVLEDVEKHEWSKQECVFNHFSLWASVESPLSLWDSVRGLSFPGTNKAGEIIMAPNLLSDGPFYIFYYNVETKNIRRVQIQGIEEIRSSYGFRSECHVHITPQHVESIAFL